MTTIRPAQAADEAAIAALVETAFGRSDEARLVETLRADGDAVAELIAEQEGRLAGHLLLSIMDAPMRALALAPVCVAPERQRCGVGTALIRAGLGAARDGGWDAVFVVGEPAYYRRFGFSADLARDFDSPYAGPFLMTLALGGPLPATRGRIGHASAFAGLT